MHRVYVAAVCPDRKTVSMTASHVYEPISDKPTGLAHLPLSLEGPVSDNAHNHHVWFGRVIDPYSY